MKNKKIIIITGIILIIGTFVFLVSPHIINWLFSSQYNDNGVSHFLVVTIDESEPREYVGELDGHRIYVEKFNLNETNFRNVDAENVSIKKSNRRKTGIIKRMEEICMENFKRWKCRSFKI